MRGSLLADGRGSDQSGRRRGKTFGVESEIDANDIVAAMASTAIGTAFTCSDPGKVHRLKLELLDTLFRLGEEQKDMKASKFSEFARQAFIINDGEPVAEAYLKAGSAIPPAFVLVE